jgi:hypothetical protein
MDGVGEEPVRRVGSAGGAPAPVAAEITRPQGVRPRREARDPPELASAGERCQRQEARRPVQERRVGGEEKRREGRALARRALAPATVEREMASVGVEVSREEARSPIPAEEERRVVAEDQPAAASTAAR